MAAAQFSVDGIIFQQDLVGETKKLMGEGEFDNLMGEKILRKLYLNFT